MKVKLLKIIRKRFHIVHHKETIRNVTYGSWSVINKKDYRYRFSEPSLEVLIDRIMNMIFSNYVCFSIKQDHETTRRIRKGKTLFKTASPHKTGINA